MKEHHVQITSANSYDVFFSFSIIYYIEMITSLGILESVERQSDLINISFDVNQCTFLFVYHANEFAHYSNQCHTNRIQLRKKIVCFCELQALQQLRFFFIVIIPKNMVICEKKNLLTFFCEPFNYAIKFW